MELRLQEVCHPCAKAVLRQHTPCAEVSLLAHSEVCSQLRPRGLNRVEVTISMKHHLYEISVLPQAPVWHTGTRYNAGCQDAAKSCPAQEAREAGSDRCPAYSLILYKAQTG